MKQTQAHFLSSNRKSLFGDASPPPVSAPGEHAVCQPGDPRGAGADRQGCTLPSMGRPDVGELHRTPHTNQNIIVYNNRIKAQILIWQKYVTLFLELCPVI